MKTILLAGCLVLASLRVLADVRLPAVIGSHMVLQQKTLVRIWGWADPGEKVLVKAGWDTAVYKATGSSAAKWELTLMTPLAGGPYTISIEGRNKILLEDVLIGEVWICSGQSNMEMSMNWGLPYQDDAAKATNNKIRFFHIPKTTANTPQEDLKAEWVVCTPETMKKFSAAGYFFGSKLQEELNLPVGLINSSWGGTPAESWTPGALIENDSILKRAAGQLKESDGWPVAPGLTFNAMIHPLLPYAIAGAIWYQGESNVETAASYRSLLTTMIGSWRKGWNRDFPFYLVQIAPFAGYGDNSSSAFLREAQTGVLSYPSTGMVLTSDLVDDINDIHPKMKKEVGIRLANYALSEVYGRKDIAYKSPVYKSMKIEKGRVRIYFDGVEKGLVSRAGAPAEFYIAGEDRNFVPAQAKIEGSTVVVWNPKVPHPAAVRFGFRNAAMPNLFSKEGLPVNLFRTDDWPVNISLDKK
jgi:sialate O-acetylesterase